jgi:hypothetical protein
VGLEANQSRVETFAHVVVDVDVLGQGAVIIAMNTTTTTRGAVDITGKLADALSELEHDAAKCDGVKVEV